MRQTWPRIWLHNLIYMYEHPTSTKKIFDKGRVLLVNYSFKLEIDFDAISMIWINSYKNNAKELMKLWT